MSLIGLDEFERKVANLQGRVEGLRERAGEALPPVTEEALTELSVAAEELRVAQEELRQQAEALATASAQVEVDRQRYADLFNFAPDGYLVTDRNGLIQEANQAAGEMLGRRPAYLVGKPLAVFVSADNRPAFRNHLGQLAASRDQRSWEGQLLVHGHPPIEVEFTVAPEHEEPDGGPVQLRWRLHDITERKMAEESLSQSREALRELSARLQTVREEERTRAARQVHDELGSTLTALKLELAQVRHKLAAVDSAGALESIDASMQTADEMMDMVRGIATELRPALLDELGLLAAVDWQLQDYQKRTGVKTALYASGQAACPPEAATVVFRVLQEILTNVTRHSRARHVEVRLSQPAGQNLVLEVRDDGRGITQAEAQQAGSLGIMGMRERLQQLGGSLSIHGTSGKGTTVVATLPLVQQP